MTVKTVRDSEPSSDSKGAVEEDMQRITTIKGGDVMGYQGEAREEHSGQNAPRETPGNTGDLADNKDQIKKD